MFSVPSFSWETLLVVPLLLIGCGEDVGPDVSEGRYRAYLEGSLTDTLTGPAVYRREGGRLVGLELGRRNGPGLSIQLGPAPLRSRTYQVMAGKLLKDVQSEGLTGLVAFLSLKNARLRAARGSLSVTHVSDGEVRGTFDFAMEGAVEGGPQEHSIRVTGALRARSK